MLLVNVTCEITKKLLLYNHTNYLAEKLYTICKPTPVPKGIVQEEMKRDLRLHIPNLLNSVQK